MSSWNAEFWKTRVANFIVTVGTGGCRSSWQHPDFSENDFLMHNYDVTISAMVSQITGVSIVCLTVCSAAYRCSPVPIFPSPLVHHSVCFPVPMFPDPIFPSSHIPQSLSSPTRYALCFPVSVFPSPFPSQSLCSTVPLFPRLDIPHKWFPVPQRYSPVPRPFVPQTRSSPELFPVPIFSPKMFHSPYVPHKCFHSLCSPKIFPSPYVPQSLCSPVPMLGLGNIGAGELVGGT